MVNTGQKSLYVYKNEFVFHFTSADDYIRCFVTFYVTMAHKAVGVTFT